MDPADSVKELIGDGQYLHAYDVAATALEHEPADVEMGYLAVLALARSGATDQARLRYDSLRLESIDPESVPSQLAESLAALGARLDKDTAMRTTAADRRRWAQRSAQGYQAAFERHRSAFLAVNAATMWLMAGKRQRAEHMAHAVFMALDGKRSTAGENGYWHAASEAEAALIVRDTPRSAAAIARAARASGGDYSARATTVRQLRLVCELTGTEPDVLKPLFNPCVAHFCGHRIAGADSSGGFAASEEPRVAAALRSAFERLGVGFGFGSLAAGADILAAEALLELGAHLNVVLPFDREEFIGTSVAPAGTSWVRRFERCIAEADEVLVATGSEHLGDPVLFDFCSRIAMGDAIMRSEFLQAEAHQVAVWDGIATEGSAGTAVDVATWASTGRPATTIGVESERTTAAGPRTAPLRQIRGIIVADFAGFSTLSDGQVLRFQDLVFGTLARAMEPFRGGILNSRTWGDGLALVISDVATSAQCALALQSAARNIDFSDLGMPTVRGMRLAAHAAPVFEGWDPIAGSRAFFGSGFTQTARIEPGTPEGEIYTTHAFAALAMLSGDQTYETQYVGTRPTAKGFGAMPLFALRSRPRPPTSSM